MPSLIAAALTSIGIGAGIAFGTVTWAAIAGYVIYSALTFVALKALMGDINMGMTSAGIQVNSVNATAPHRVIYGQQRVGGVITYQEATDDNKFLHLFICVAGHEVEEIGQIYINDEAVTLDGSGFVTSNDWDSKIRIKKHLGTSTQATDPDFLLETENPDIDSSFTGRGIAYLYVRMTYDAEVFAQGMPLVTALVKGRKVLDPRTGVTAYSTNAALCIRDYASVDFGIGAIANELDDAIWGAEADICDEAVTLAAGGTENRYELNGSFTLDLPPKDVMPRMLTACAGTFFWSQGEFILKTGYYSTPVATFDESHLRSGIQIDPRVSSRDNFNIVRGTFMDAGQKWITVDYPEVTGAAFVAEDNGEENAIDLPLPFTTSNPMAQRLAKVTLYRNREQITFSGKFSLEAYSVQVGDNINITNAQMGFVVKPFEVQAWQLVYEKGSPIAVNMTLREISAAAFSWSAEESDIIGNETILPPRSFYYNHARYQIFVATLPVNAAEAKSVFQTLIGTPINNDVAIFSVLSGVDVVAQSVWEYRYVTDDWTQRTQDIDGETIIDGTIGTLVLEDGAISTIKLANAAVDGTKLDVLAVGTTHLVDNAVDGDKLGSLSVNTAHLINDAVDGTKVAGSAIDTAHIVNAAIDGTKLDALAVDTSHIINDAVDGTKLAAVSVDTGHVVDGAVETEKVGTSAVSDFSGVTVTTTSWVDSGSWTASQTIDEIEVQINADDDLAAEKILFTGELATYLHTLTVPTVNTLSSIYARWSLNVYIRTGTDTIILGKIGTIMDSYWLNKTQYAAIIGQLPPITLYIEKGTHYSAGDLLVFKFEFRKSRTGSTTINYVADIDKIFGVVQELKR